MIAKLVHKSSDPGTRFPKSEVERRLRKELEQIARDAELTRLEWEPLLDSQRVVASVAALEDLFPCKLPPDQVVKKGGYQDVNEAIQDMVARIEGVMTRFQKRGR